MTITTSPSTWSSIHRPIVYEIDPVYTFTAATSFSGNLEIIISPSVDLAAFIIGTNAVIPSGIYAGTYKILSKGGNSLRLDTSYTSGASGSVYSTRLPCQVYAGYDAAHPGYADYPYGLVANITGIGGADGVVKIDISGFLKSVIKEVKAPRIGRDFQMSIPYKMVIGHDSDSIKYALNGTLEQSDLDSNFPPGTILNAREPIHFQNGRTIYSMIWRDTAEFGEHIVNIVATQGTGLA